MQAIPNTVDIADAPTAISTTWAVSVPDMIAAASPPVPDSPFDPDGSIVIAAAAAAVGDGAAASNWNVAPATPKSVVVPPDVDGAPVDVELVLDIVVVLVIGTLTRGGGGDAGGGVGNGRAAAGAATLVAVGGAGRAAGAAALPDSGFMLRVKLKSVLLLPTIDTPGHSLSPMHLSAPLPSFHRYAATHALSG